MVKGNEAKSKREAKKEKSTKRAPGTKDATRKQPKNKSGTLAFREARRLNRKRQSIIPSAVILREFRAALERAPHQALAKEDIAKLRIRKPAIQLLRLSAERRLKQHIAMAKIIQQKLQPATKYDEKSKHTRDNIKKLGTIEQAISRLGGVDKLPQDSATEGVHIFRDNGRILGRHAKVARLIVETNGGAV